MSAVLPDSDSDAEAAAREGPAAGGAQPLVLVMNQGSGKNAKGEVRAAIEAEFRRAGRAHHFVAIEPGQVVQACMEAARQAAERQGVLVAVGGDGTLNAAAQAALAQDCPLGVIAQGTFNLFARHHGLPLDAAAAARALLHARPEPVQVGLVNQRVFLVNASVGLYPKLLADREEVKQRLGRRRWIAMLAALKSLLQWRLRLDLEAELDGELRRLRTSSLFLCNNPLQLQRLGVPDAVVGQVGSGRLAALLVRPLAWATKLELLWRAAFGRLGDADEVDSVALRSLNLTTRHARKLKVATDGEVLWMQLPLRFSVSPRPLRLMLPPLDERLPPA